MNHLNRAGEQAPKKIKIAFVAPYIPRECGIATYTKDIVTAVDGQNEYSSTSVVVIDDSDGELEYPDKVSFSIPQNDFDGYLNAAARINRSSIDIVHIQHEFGIFGGTDGEYIMEFAKRIDKPLVITFHTVLSKPDQNKLKIVRGLCGYAKTIIVMADEAMRRMIKSYGVDSNKIVVIPHGVPDIPFGQSIGHKKTLGFQNKYIISTFGLISRNKGLEYAIEGLKEIANHRQDFIFLIIGKTHPNVIRQEGDSYRDSLHKIVIKNNLGKFVKFINRYLTLPELVFYLQATDIYVTPYLEPEQITSGTLSYALGAGKACVSTPYAYAKEVLRGNKGILVDFKNSCELGKAISRLINNSKLRDMISKRAYQSSRKMIWPSVGERHLRLYRKLYSHDQNQTIINKSNEQIVRLGTIDESKLKGVQNG